MQARKLLALFTVLFTALSPLHGQTVNLLVSATNFNRLPAANCVIQLTPAFNLPPQTNAILVPATITGYSDTNGNYTFSNTFTGYTYTLALNYSFGIFTTNIGLPSGLSGTVNAAAYQGVWLPGQQIFAYTSTNYFFPTNYTTNGGAYTGTFFDLGNTNQAGSANLTNLSQLSPGALAYLQQLSQSNAANLTNLNASNLVGTIATNNLPGLLPTLANSNAVSLTNITGSNFAPQQPYTIFGNGTSSQAEPGGETNGTWLANTINAQFFNGNGAGLTNLAASCLSNSLASNAVYGDIYDFSNSPAQPGMIHLGVTGGGVGPGIGFFSDAGLTLSLQGVEYYNIAHSYEPEYQVSINGSMAWAIGQDGQGKGRFQAGASGAYHNTWVWQYDNPNNNFGNAPTNFLGNGIPQVFSFNVWSNGAGITHYGALWAQSTATNGAWNLNFYDVWHPTSMYNQIQQDAGVQHWAGGFNSSNIFWGSMTASNGFSDTSAAADTLSGVLTATNPANVLGGNGGGLTNLPAIPITFSLQGVSLGSGNNYFSFDGRDSFGFSTMTQCAWPASAYISGISMQVVATGAGLLATTNLYLYLFSNGSTRTYTGMNFQGAAGGSPFTTNVSPNISLNGITNYGWTWSNTSVNATATLHINGTIYITVR